MKTIPDEAESLRSFSITPPPDSCGSALSSLLADAPEPSGQRWEGSSPTPRMQAARDDVDDEDDVEDDDDWDDDEDVDDDDDDDDDDEDELEDDDDWDDDDDFDDDFDDDDDDFDEED